MTAFDLHTGLVEATGMLQLEIEGFLLVVGDQVGGQGAARLLAGDNAITDPDSCSATLDVA